MRMTCFSKMWLLQNVHRVKVIALTIFLYLISPLILTCILCLYLYRLIVSVWAKLSRNDLQGIVGLYQSVFASDKGFYSIPNFGVVSVLVLKGNLSLETLQNVIDEKILSLKNAKGTYKYKSLRMYPTRVGNFWFWKDEAEFKLGTHVIMYEKARERDNNRIWTPADLQKIQTNLIRRPWKRFTSPWEIVILNNYSQNRGGRELKTLIFLRYHMCIGNLPWMKLLMNMLCEGEGEPDISSSTESVPFSRVPAESRVPTVVDVSEKTSSTSVQTSFHGTENKLDFFIKRIVGRLLIPFKIPLDFAETLLESSSSNCGREEGNDWSVDEKNLLKKDHVVTLDRFSVQHVKEIKNMLGVSFSSVLASAFCSALRVTFIEAGMKIPSKFPVLLPLCPKGGNERDTHVESEGSMCWINLPLGVSSSRERLRCCEAAQKNLQKSTRLITNKFLLSMVGLLPFKYHWYFIRRRPWIGVMMNVKGPKETLTLCDHQIEDVIISSASDSGFVLSFVSYADYLRISLVIDYRLVPNEIQAKNLLKNIYAELVLLGIDGAAIV